MYDNHPGDMGTELFEREKDMALNVHAGSELDKVESALQAMEDGSYGKCEVCQKDIPFERLEAVPYTTLCIDHATEQEVPQDRPVRRRYAYHGQPEFICDRSRSSPGWRRQLSGNCKIRNIRNSFRFHR